MSYDIYFNLGFEDDSDPEVVAEIVTALCDALVLADCLWLEGTPETPPLYDSGVVYRRETTRENFWDIPKVLRHGYADCEDLASWRCAELIVREGVEAYPLVTWQYYRPRIRGAYRVEYHVRVATPFGIEDPSMILGMEA